MGEVFLKVLNMSIAASWLILTVMLLRFVLKKAPKWISVLLWGIVALRLAVPFSFESALSLIPSAETFNAHNIQYETPAINSGIPAVNHAVNPVLGETFAPSPATSVNPFYVWTFIVSVIWLIGIAAMLLYPISSYMVTGDMVKDPEYINNVRAMLGLDGASMGSTEIVNIVDRTKTEGLSYDTAVEKFFVDGDNEYYFSGIYSHYVIVHYEDGSQEDIVTALNAGRAAIADLDKFEVDYIVRALGTENQV